MDRQPFYFGQMKEVDKDGSVGKMWYEISVECKGHDLECNWTGLARDHREHIRSCSHGTPQYVYDCIIRLYRKPPAGGVQELGR